MRRNLCLFVLVSFVLAVFTVPIQGQSGGVQTVGDVSFSVPDGWTYTAGRDFGAVSLKDSNTFWLVSVYTPMPSSGDPNADFKAAWRRVALAIPGYRELGYDPYKITQTVGYPGVYYDGYNDTTYTRLYVLETGKSCIPVAFVSQSRGTLDGMEHSARAIVGSVRQAPLRALPTKYSITVSDLEGEWKSGLVNSIDYYNRAGQYQSNSFTAVQYTYIIAGNGSYVYKFGGMINNRMTRDDDTGVVEFGGAFLTFNGKRRHNRYRFAYMQQALDGSTVLTLFPDADMSKINPSRDSTFFTRLAKK